MGIRCQFVVEPSQQLGCGHPFSCLALDHYVGNSSSSASKSGYQLLGLVTFDGHHVVIRAL